MATLDELFARLQQATLPTEIAAAEDEIRQIWLSAGHPVLDKRLENGLRALAADDCTLAIAEFTFLLETAPYYAEAWYQRALAHGQRGSLRAALRDLAQALAREPRHFGALLARAQLCQQLQHWSAARKNLERVAALCPHWPGIREQLYDLRYKSSNSGN